MNCVIASVIIRPPSVNQNTAPMKFLHVALSVSKGVTHGSCTKLIGPISLDDSDITDPYAWHGSLRNGSHW